MKRERGKGKRRETQNEWVTVKVWQHTNGRVWQPTHRHPKGEWVTLEGNTIPFPPLLILVCHFRTARGAFLADCILPEGERGWCLEVRERLPSTYGP